MALITLQEVSHSFTGLPLLDGIGLQIEPGERLGLLGRNGAGKSTLMRILAGEIDPDGGRVIRQQGLRVARLVQEVPRDMQGPVSEQVAGGLTPDPDDPDADRRRVERILSRME